MFVAFVIFLIISCIMGCPPYEFSSLACAGIWRNGDIWPAVTPLSWAKVKIFPKYCILCCHLIFFKLTANMATSCMLLWKSLHYPDNPVSCYSVFLFSSSPFSHSISYRWSFSPTQVRSTRARWWKRSRTNMIYVKTVQSRSGVCHTVIVAVFTLIKSETCSCLQSLLVCHISRHHCVTFFVSFK